MYIVPGPYAIYRYVLMHVLYMTVEYIRSMYSIHVPKTSVRPSSQYDTSMGTWH